MVNKTFTYMYVALRFPRKKIHFYRVRTEPTSNQGSEDLERLQGLQVFAQIRDWLDTVH